MTPSNNIDLPVQNEFIFEPTGTTHGGKIIKSQYTYFRDYHKIQNQHYDQSSSFMLRIHENIQVNLHQVPVYILQRQSQNTKPTL